jgi:SAM-dependent methyltransferase
MDFSLLEALLKCPICGHELSHNPATFFCRNNHSFPYQGNFIDFSVECGRPDEIQERSKKAFQTEWCNYYPRLGWHPSELSHETDMFLAYTRTMPNFFHNKVVVDAGCGNGRYINVVNRISSPRPRLIIGIEISDSAVLASKNCSHFDNVVILKADINNLPNILKEPVDYIYSIGVLHYTPDAEAAFHNLAKCIKVSGFLSIHLYGKGNPVLFRVNSFLRNKFFRSWPDRLVYWLCVVVAIPCQIFRVKLVGYWLDDLVNRVVFVSPNVHNMFNAYTGGQTSFHDRNQVEQWYRKDGYDCVVEPQNNNRSLFCIGRRLE